MIPGVVPVCVGKGMMRSVSPIWVGVTVKCLGFLLPVWGWGNARYSLWLLKGLEIMQRSLLSIGNWGCLNSL